MKKHYLVGNAHIDPVWLWRWQDGYSEVLATFRSALDRMKEFEDYKFTSACSAYYRWVEETDPSMFEEIRKRVKEGRWNIVGGWVIQPDCNLPCGESFARQALVGQRYFKEKFGVCAKSGYNVDSFGHNASLPKILRAGGMSRYVFMRPSEGEYPLGFDQFIWESDDGSAVTASRILSYGPSMMVEKIRANAARTKADGVERMSFFGVGNHGGGASAQFLEELHRAMQKEDVFASVDDFFDDNKNTNLPVVRTELQHHARGCYSAMNEVKGQNRLCEENLLAAERICLLAARLTDYPYPGAELKKAWENLLFNQFHDILAGCAIESAYRDAANLFGETMSVTERELNLAMQAIAKKVETARGGNPGGAVKKHFLVWEHEKLGTPVLVFNPHAFPVRAAVRRRAECARMTDETGREIPFQMIRGEATNGKSDIYELTFQAEVPAMGYRLYRVFVSGEAERGETVFADEHTLENAVLRVELDRGSGEIAKIISKTNGAVIADGGFDAVLTDETACDTWAHGQFDLGEVCGRFSAPEFEVLESGAVCAALRVTVHHEVCTLTREYWLYAGSDELRVSLTADFHGKHRALKLCFPAKDEVTCEIPFGTVTRSLCQGEEPFGKWFASAGVGVANIGKYGYDSTADSVRMTVLRGAAFADHYGVRDGRLHYMSQGIHHTEYTVFPFSSATDAHRRAALLNSPLRAINAGFHHGTLPERYSAVSGVPENVFVSAIKKNEDGNGAILRAYECEGKPAHGAVTLFDRKIPLSLTPYSIETVNEQGERLDFMEWKL